MLINKYYTQILVFPYLMAKSWKQDDCLNISWHSTVLSNLSTLLQRKFYMSEINQCYKVPSFYLKDHLKSEGNRLNNNNNYKLYFS